MSTTSFWNLILTISFLNCLKTTVGIKWTEQDFKWCTNIVSSMWTFHKLWWRSPNIAKLKYFRYDQLRLKCKIKLIFVLKKQVFRIAMSMFQPLRLTSVTTPTVFSFTWIHGKSLFLRLWFVKILIIKRSLDENIAYRNLSQILRTSYIL